MKETNYLTSINESWNMLYDMLAKNIHQRLTQQGNEKYRRNNSIYDVLLFFGCVQNGRICHREIGAIFFMKRYIYIIYKKTESNAGNDSRNDIRNKMNA